MVVHSKHSNFNPKRVRTPCILRPRPTCSCTLLNLKECLDLKKVLHILTSRKQLEIEVLGQEAMYPNLAQVCILDDLLDANRVMGQIVNKKGKV